MFIAAFLIKRWKSEPAQIFVIWRMDKQIVIFIKLNTTQQFKKRINSMQLHRRNLKNVEWKKHKRILLLNYSIYMKSKDRQNLWEVRVGTNWTGHKRTSCSDGSTLYFSSGCTSIYNCQNSLSWTVNFCTFKFYVYFTLVITRNTCLELRGVGTRS